jgi:hypothetical protein
MRLRVGQKRRIQQHDLSTNAHGSRPTLAFAFASLSAVPSFADSAKSQVIGRELRSENIAHNKIGTNLVRKMVVYLPAGYDESSKNNPAERYPVIYFLPSPFENYRLAFDQRDAQGLLADYGLCGHNQITSGLPAIGSLTHKAFPYPAS